MSYRFKFIKWLKTIRKGIFDPRKIPWGPGVGKCDLCGDIMVLYTFYMFDEEGTTKYYCIECYEKRCQENS